MSKRHRQGLINPLISNFMHGVFVKGLFSSFIALQLNREVGLTISAVLQWYQFLMHLAPCFGATPNTRGPDDLPHPSAQ